MPSRRRPQDALSVNKIIGFAAAAILFIPRLVDAQQQPQQKSPVLQRHESQHEARGLEVTKIAQNLETPVNPRRRKDTLSVTHQQLLNIKRESDVSAIATSRPSSNAGISQHTARNLEDWEVEDFVLLATVDGRLHARDRKTGEERWTLMHERPMVHTQYHRRTRSLEEDYTASSLDDYLWIVEPSRDGSLYYYNPSGSERGLVNTGLTIKKIVDEMSPYRGQDPHVTYTGGKTTNMVTIDAITGAVVKSFGLGGKRTNSGRCAKSRTFMDNGECSPNSTVSIGRSEYTVIIEDGKTEDPIATLTFSEWTPNNFDQDLHQQYHTTLDSKYIYASHDGSVIGLDHTRNTAEEPGKLFQHKFSSPVVRVFDIARPWDTDKSDPELVVLPQPLPPIAGDDDGWPNPPMSSVFLNHTEDGSWYAMSGMTYPYAVQGVRHALCNQDGWMLTHPAWDITNEVELHEGLVGLHNVDRRSQERKRTISAPFQDENKSDISSPPEVGKALSLEDDPTFTDSFFALKLALVKFVGAFAWLNSPFVFALFAFVYYNWRQIMTWLRSTRLVSLLPVKKEIEPADVPLPAFHDLPPLEVPMHDSADVPSVIETREAFALQSEEDLKGAKEERPEKTENSTEQAAPVLKEKLVAPVLSEIVNGDKPKKAHRGRRGGVKHKKGPKPSENSQDGTASQDGNPPKPPPTVDDAVRNAQNMGKDQESRLEPDIKTISTNPNEVSGPIIRVGALQVNTDKLIGSGSNGTMVFSGKFDGRDVAVKRMLMHYFDIASQETKLLRESDDHENVIRYYAQQQAGGFLYIALELCPASLADVIDKPHLHRELAQKGEQDLPHVLYQITNGIQHLHSLRIVHRDLKPQNILVNTHKDGRPRLLVSDFGLCKKLDGEQSSFRATTAHAAGTSGWRAPELLLDDDANHGLSMVDASTEGNSGPLVNPELLPNRRATRAIDIFSLGLVFYYVLTKGCHPFDCGDRYMREVNIRKGVYNLNELSVLGDYSYEATDLIGSMLQAEPKRRPSARDVLAHPFFWKAKTRLNFLCDVSDHFEKEKRDPPSPALQELERYAEEVCRGDFLKYLGKEFVDSMGKQRKYTGTRLLDLLRALRNKKNHYEDMSDHLKEHVGPLPDGYLSFWTRKFPNLLTACWNIVYELRWDDTDRFREYYQPAGL